MNKAMECFLKSASWHGVHNDDWAKERKGRDISKKIVCTS